MAKAFHDINEPGFYVSQKQQPKQKPFTGVDDEPEEEKNPEPEVRLISAKWVPGPTGFQYKEQCFVDVQTEFLPGKEKTIRLRVRGKLFGTYKGEEHDLSQEVVGYINRDTGIARLEIKKLWHIEEHYPDWYNDHSIPCTYKIKGIFHSLGENEIDSPELAMPANLLRTHLNIHPDSPVAKHLRFVLSCDAAGSDFSQEQTVEDDIIPNDEFTDLEFRGLPEQGPFTLKIVDQKNHREYVVFQEKSLEEVKNNV